MWYEFIKQEITAGNLVWRETAIQAQSGQSSGGEYKYDSMQPMASWWQKTILGPSQKEVILCQIETYLLKHETRLGEKYKTVQPEAIKIDFSPNAIDRRIFPYEAFRKIFKATFNEYDSNLLNKPDIQGELELRRALVELLYRSRGGAFVQPNRSLSAPERIICCRF